MLNAGRGGPSKDFAPGGDLDAWNKTLGVNLFGVLHGTQAFVDRMVNQVSVTRLHGYGRCDTELKLLSRTRLAAL